VTALEKVLVVGPSWVGDMVMAQALYRSLKQRNAAAEIHVVAPSWSLPVLERMPEVARAIELAVGHGELALGRRRALGKQLRSEHYSHAIVLPRSLKAALVPWFARIPRRTGFRGEWRYGLLNDMRAQHASLDQTVKRFVALGNERGEPVAPLSAELYPHLRVSAANLERLRAEHALDARDALVALMPGAEYGAAKRWPAARFAELAAWLAGAGTNVVLLGSAKERPLGDEIVAAAGKPRVRNLCGKTSLADVIDLLAAADAAVSNDSGLLHVAAASGTPVVAIYGSSSPQFTPPLTQSAAVLYLGIECSPCFQRECPLGHLRCLTEISVERVEAALAALRRSRGTRPGVRADA
jgi:lipopolysaccharide heptosyltransferase II